MKSQEQILKRKNQLIHLTSEFCDQKLDEEHKELLEKLIQKLYKEEPGILTQESLEEWASAIIHAIGSVNLLFDDSFEPHISEDELNEFFGTSPEKTLKNSEYIKDKLNLDIFDGEFSTHTMDENNPLNEMVAIDGIYVRLELLPSKLREKVEQVRKDGYRIEFRSDEV